MPKHRPKSEAERAKELDRGFRERGGKTIVTKPLSAQEVKTLKRTTPEAETEAQTPTLQESISIKIKHGKEKALSALNPQEKRILSNYLDSVWYKYQNLALITNHLNQLLDPDETPVKLSESEYQDLIDLINDPAAVAREVGDPTALEEVS